MNLDVIASIYLTLLWLSLVFIGARLNHRYLMMLALLFLAGASVNSFLDEIPNIQAVARMAINTGVFLFVIYAARRLPDVKR